MIIRSIAPMTVQIAPHDAPGPVLAPQVTSLRFGLARAAALTGRPGDRNGMALAAGPALPEIGLSLRAQAGLFDALMASVLGGGWQPDGGGGWQVMAGADAGRHDVVVQAASGTTATAVPAARIARLSVVVDHDRMPVLDLLLRGAATGPGSIAADIAVAGGGFRGAAARLSIDDQPLAWVTACRIDIEARLYLHQSPDPLEPGSVIAGGLAIGARIDLGVEAAGLAARLPPGAPLRLALTLEGAAPGTSRRIVLAGALVTASRLHAPADGGAGVPALRLTMTCGATAGAPAIVVHRDAA